VGFHARGRFAQDTDFLERATRLNESSTGRPQNLLVVSEGEFHGTHLESTSDYACCSQLGDSFIGIPEFMEDRMRVLTDNTPRSYHHPGSREPSQSGHAQVGSEERMLDHSSHAELGGETTLVHDAM